MLEGLEVTVKQFSDLSNNDDDTLRFDAEHFQRKYLQIVEKLKTHNYSKLLDLIKKPVITGHTPSMKVDRFYGGEIAFIKTDNLRENNIVEFYTDYLSADGDCELNSSRLKPKDILVTIIGATHEIVGRCAIVRDEHLPANINQNIALIQANESKINSNYLNIYLNTQFGRGMLHFHSRQTEQVNLNCREVERVLVPIFPSLENEVEIVSNQAYVAITKAKDLYNKAEQTLIEAVGLADFKPSTQNTNIKSFSQCFNASGRLDAEYYQLKYEDYENIIKSHPNGYTLISHEYEHFCTISRKPKATYNYIEISDVNVSDGTNSPNLLETSELPDNAKYEVKKGDLIISKVRPNRGAVTVIESDADNLIVSGAFTVLREKPDSVFTKEVLKVLLRTPIYREWMLQFNIGTQYPVIRDDDILNLPIPKIDLETQTQISVLIQQSFILKTESERLLNVAKRAVEIAIEQDEAAGLAFIEKETEPNHVIH